MKGFPANSVNKILKTRLPPHNKTLCLCDRNSCSRKDAERKVVKETNIRMYEQVSNPFTTVNVLAFAVQPCGLERVDLNSP
jgi:hypothetical protein